MKRNRGFLIVKKFPKKTKNHEMLESVSQYFPNPFPVCGTPSQFGSYEDVNLNNIIEKYNHSFIFTKRAGHCIFSSHYSDRIKICIY